MFFSSKAGGGGSFLELAFYGLPESGAEAKER